MSASRLHLRPDVRDRREVDETQPDQDVVGVPDQAEAPLQQVVAPGAERREDDAGYGQCTLAQRRLRSRGAHRARLDGRLDHDDQVGQYGDDPLAWDDSGGVEMAASGLGATSAPSASTMLPAALTIEIWPDKSGCAGS